MPQDPPNTPVISPKRNPNVENRPNPKGKRDPLVNIAIAGWNIPTFPIRNTSTKNPGPIFPAIAMLVDPGMTVFQPSIFQELKKLLAISHQLGAEVGTKNPPRNIGPSRTRDWARRCSANSCKMPIGSMYGIFTSIYLYYPTFGPVDVYGKCR